MYKSVGAVLDGAVFLIERWKKVLGVVGIVTKTSRIVAKMEVIVAKTSLIVALFFSERFIVVKLSQKVVKIEG